MHAPTRTVMITGAAGNLGRCVAASFLASGAHLVLVDRRRESLAQAFGAEDERRLFINVNCVLPSIIDTPENRAAMPDADPTRWVAAEDLASVIAFLASDAARAIHGAALPVTGLS